MTEKAYDSENLLQGLLARYPNLLAGDQMDTTQLDLTWLGGYLRVWRQSLHGGSPHAEEYWGPLHSGVQGRGRSAGPLYRVTWVGCIVSLTTPIRSSLRASKSVR